MTTYADRQIDKEKEGGGGTVYTGYGETGLDLNVRTEHIQTNKHK